MASAGRLGRLGFGCDFRICIRILALGFVSRHSGPVLRQNSMRTENSAIPCRDGCLIQVIPSPSDAKNLSRGTLAVYLYVGCLPTGLLTLQISFQYSRNPALCQRTTVSGVTTMRDCCHPDQNRRTATQKSLSSRSNLGRGCRRFSTASC